MLHKTISISGDKSGLTKIYIISNLKSQIAAIVTENIKDDNEDKINIEILEARADLLFYELFEGKNE